jgi:hypothetical protein
MNAPIGPKHEDELSRLACDPERLARVSARVDMLHLYFEAVLAELQSITRLLEEVRELLNNGKHIE